MDKKKKKRSKPVLTQAWVNDAAFFDGTGFAEVIIADEPIKMQRFEQEVKLLSQKGILLLLQNGVIQYSICAFDEISEAAVNPKYTSIYDHIVSLSVDST